MLEEIKKKALEEHIPIIMDDTLERIEQIIKEEKPHRILEIGTAVGYSACCFAKASSDDCIIDTIELDEIRANEAIENINIIKNSNFYSYNKFFGIKNNSIISQIKEMQ